MSDEVGRRPALVTDILLWLGLAVLAIGIVLGIRPVTAEGYACGKPFGRGELQIATVRVADACEDAMDSRRVLAFGAVVAGGALAGVTAWVRSRTGRPRTPPPQ